LSCAILAIVAHHASELEAKRAMEMPMWRLVLHLAKSVRMIVYSDLIFLPVTNVSDSTKLVQICDTATQEAGIFETFFVRKEAARCDWFAFTHSAIL
jgi:hypothetical protein